MYKGFLSGKENDLSTALRHSSSQTFRSVLDLSIAARSKPQTPLYKKNQMPPAELSAKIRSLLMSLEQKVAPEQEAAIEEYIFHHSEEEIGTLLVGLYEASLMGKLMLIKLASKNNEVAKNSQVRSWWRAQKHKLCSECTFPFDLKRGKRTKIDTLLTQVVNEKQLVRNLKTHLKTYVKENFYIYKLGHSYYFSPIPNEESIGTRCDQEGNPLKDELGNNLTDNFGNFRYAIINLKKVNKKLIEEKIEVHQKTEGATPLTDKNGVPLTTKYHQMIQQDKPKGNDKDKKKAEAVHHLLQKIESCSASEIYNFLKTPNLQDLIGANEYSFAIWKTSLAQICQKFTTDYEKILNLMPDEVILSNLLDPTIYLRLSANDIASLFWHYNPILITNIIVNLYEDKKFKDNNLNFNFLQELLNGNPEIIEIINQKRCKLKTTLLLPFDACLPGKNNLEEEKLTRYQLFQYDDKTIAAVEEWFRKKFPHLIINSHSDSRPARLEQASPFYFYQIPANSYMLLDPTDVSNPYFYRYQQLKRDLPQLVSNEKIFNKPIIFFGIMNVFNTHYIPYFIYQNDYHQTYIITIDSSPAIYPKNIQSKKYIDSKVNIYNKLKLTFNDLFPKCQFYDPLITQMLRERDCGPNSAQTIFDALHTTESYLTTKCPPLIFIKEASLKINLQALTLKGRPNGVNPYTKTYVYPSSIAIKSNKNRFVWQQILSQITQISFYKWPNELTKSMFDHFEELPEEYSYIAQVETQKLYDDKNNCMSEIQSILLSDEAGRKMVDEIIEDYKHTLQLSPTYSSKLVTFIRNTLENQLYTHAYSNLEALVEDLLMRVILKDYIPEALQTTLQATVLNHLPNSLDLSSEEVVDKFLTTHMTVFKNLSPDDQMRIRHDLKNKAEIAVREKLVTLHLNIILDLLTRNGDIYLGQLPISYPQEEITSLFLKQLHKEPIASFFEDKEGKVPPEKIARAFSYLKSHAYPILKSLLLREVEGTLERITTATLEYAKQQLNLARWSMVNLLKFFDLNTHVFLAPDPQLFLPAEHTHNILSRNEINSALGVWLIPQINLAFLQEIHQVLIVLAKKHAKRFVNNSKFLEQFTSASLETMENWLNDDNTLNLNAVHHFELIVASMLAKYGDPNSISTENYKHPITHSYLRLELLRRVESAVKTARQERYEQISLYILELNKRKLIFQEFTNNFKINQDLTSQLFVSAINGNGLNDFYAFFSMAPLHAHSAKNYLLNQHGTRFYHFFANIYSKMIVRNYNQVSHFQTYLEAVISFLNKLLAKENNQINSTLSEHLIIFQQIIKTLPVISLSLECEDQIKQRERDFHAALSNLMTEFLKLGYETGNLVPGSITTLLRPTFCSLLNIKAPPLLTPSQAKQIDQEIYTNIDQFKEGGNTNYNFIESPLIMMNRASTLPQTFNQPITRELLIEIISYWYTNRSVLTDIQFILEPDKLPSLIREVIQLVNNWTQPFNEQQRVFLKYLLQFDFKKQLEIVTDNKLISQVCSALLVTQDIAGELKTTEYSFTKLINLLIGQPIQTLSEKKEEKTTQIKITRAAFEQKVIEEARRRNRIAREEIENQKALLPIEEQSKLKFKSVDFKEVRSDLSSRYEIEGSIEEDINLNYIPSKDLQRSDFNSFFSRTHLEKVLRSLQARHPEKDQVDEWDLQQMVLMLKERWRRLCLTAKTEEAAATYYLEPKPKDSQYIALAHILAQYYRKQGKVAFVYDLLMPGYLIPPEQLQATTFPATTYNVSYNLNSETPQEIPATIDDIPLPNLIILHTGYALDFNWVLYTYIHFQKLTNPYTDKAFTEQEMDQILKHPQSHLLINQVITNCVPHLTRRAVGLLKDYILGTVFPSGFGGMYNNEENKKMASANVRFFHGLNAISISERRALMKEPIPNSVETVEQVLASSADRCAASRGVDLAMVVIAYHKEDHGLPKNITERISIRNIHSRSYTKPANISPLENYILKFDANINLYLSHHSY